MPATGVRFDGRAILVTGAGRGLGRAYALLLATRGARVVVADNGVAMSGDAPNAQPAQAVVDEIRGCGGEAVHCTADLMQEAGAQAAVSAALDAFGRIDGVLHNASTVPELAAPDALVSDDLDRVLRINAYAGAWLARAAWPRMKTQGYGRLLYTTSAGVYGAKGTIAYSAAKAAMIGIVRSLAQDGAEHGILVNGIAPSARTRMTEHFLGSAYADWFMQTMAPEKVAPVAAYLMSEDCQVSGEVICAGGGRVARMVLGETDGVITTGESIEEIRDVLADVVAETEAFPCPALSNRSARVAGLLGFRGGQV